MSQKGLSYNSETGEFVNNASGRVVGSMTQKGYLTCWEIMKGPIPKGMQIDHMNGDRTDNRIAEFSRRKK